MKEWIKEAGETKCICKRCQTMRLLVHEIESLAAENERLRGKCEKKNKTIERTIVVFNELLERNGTMDSGPYPLGVVAVSQIIQLLPKLQEALKELEE